MRNRFDQQLRLLHLEMVKLGALCETAISAAAKALLEQDEEMARKASATEEEIDLREREIEKLCLDLLLRQQPVARDLRTISAALKMLSDLERIGDQAADIADLTPFTGVIPNIGREHIAQMARTAVRMVTDSMDAFVHVDLEMAAAVVAADDGMDDLFCRVKEDLSQLIKTGQADADQVLDLLMVAKYFERIGDHAVNVAEWVQFSITGDKHGADNEENGVKE